MRLPRLFNILLISALTFCSSLSFGQYEDNPLKDKQWSTLSLGANTADNISYQVLLSHSMRSETVITSFRLAYNQELFSSNNDSVTSFKNKSVELGMMWGDGFGGDKWYMSLNGGMGLNIRRYGDDVEDTTLVRRLTGVTIGVPVQLEAGAFITNEWGIVFCGVANWNFRQPYVGATLGVVYRPKRKKK